MSNSLDHFSIFFSIFQSFHIRGLFRDSMGRALVCFSENLGVASSLEAVLVATMLAIEIDASRNWRF